MALVSWKFTIRHCFDQVLFGILKLTTRFPRTTNRWGHVTRARRHVWGFDLLFERHGEGFHGRLLLQIIRNWGTKILFCGCALKCFSTRGTNSKTTMNWHFISDKEDCIEYLLLVKLFVKCLLSYFLGINTLKGTAKALAVELVRPNSLRITKTTFLTPERDDERPRPF